MNTIQAQVTEWGERFSALPKQLTYVFSMDLVHVVAATSPTMGGGSAIVGNIARANETPKDAAADGACPPQPTANRAALGAGFTYHVRDEVLFKSPDGIVRDVPRAEVEFAQCRVDVEGSGAGPIAGRARLAVEGGSVSLEYTGVVALTRDVGAVLSHLSDDRNPPRNSRKAPVEVAVGSAFSTLRSTTERPKYRWLMENQLFGFGRVCALWEDSPLLRFSYDIYLAG